MLKSKSTIQCGCTEFVPSPIPGRFVSIGMATQLLLFLLLHVQLDRRSANGQSVVEEGSIKYNSEALRN